MEDVEVLKKNCEDYTHSDSKAIDVLRNANGKKDYKNIAKIVGIHPTRSSSLLKKSFKLGLSTKNKEGFYHKKPGILGFMPKGNKNKRQETNIEKKIWGVTKKALRASKVSSSFLSKYNVSHTDKMAEAYVWLYTTENVLRDLVRRVLGPVNQWWKSLVNVDIQKKVSQAIKDYPYTGATRKDELEYTHIGQLKEIIVSTINWPRFKNHLNEDNKSNFELKINNAIPSRNSIGHCIPLDTDDRADVVVRFRDILKMIK